MVTRSKMYLNRNAVCLLVMTVLVGCVSCRSVVSQHVHIDRNETSLLESWKKIQENIKWFKDEAVRRILPTLLRFSGELDVSRDCTTSLQKLVFSLTRLELWALRLLDAFGKLESGYLEGTTSSFGSYDECLSVVAPGPTPNQPDFVGQYCTIDFSVPLPPKPEYYNIFKTIDSIKNITADNPLFEELKHLIQFAYVMALRFGACVPSTCTKEDISIISQKAANLIGVVSHVNNCEVKTVLSYNTAQYAMIIVLILIAVVTFGCTILDAYPRIWSCGESLEHQQLSTLSLPRKLIRIFSVNYHVVRLGRPRANPELGFLYGFKFFTFTWVIVGQSYLQVNYQLIREIRIAKSVVQNFSFQPVVNAVLCMDSFFFLTGLLIAYRIIGNVKQFGRKSFSSVFFVVKKIWRVVPITAMGIGLALALPLAADGPIWKETIEENVNNCQRNWWPTLLFVQNFFSVEEMCLPHLWYYAVDMQLYFIALSFLLIYFWKRSAGVAFGVLMVLTSSVLSGFFTFWLRGSPTMIIANPDLEQTRRNLYITQYLPHVHLGPYAIGLLLGCYLSKKPSIRISRWLQWILWILCIAMNMSVCYGIVVWNRGKFPEIVETVTYSALNRIAWTFGLTWLVVACYSGCGGFITRFLSWSPFVFLSRLVYPAYMMHLLMVWFFVGRQKTTIMGQQHQGVSLNVSGIASCLFVAFQFHVHFEGPIIQLGKLILEKLNWFQGDLLAKSETGSVDLISGIKMAANSTSSDDNKVHTNAYVTPTDNSAYEAPGKQRFVYRL